MERGISPKEVRAVAMLPTLPGGMGWKSTWLGPNCAYERKEIETWSMRNEHWENGSPRPYICNPSSRVSHRVRSLFLWQEEPIRIPGEDELTLESEIMFGHPE